MTTKFVGMKDFRQNMSAYTKLSKGLEASEKQIKDGKFYTQEGVMKEFGLL